MPVKNHKSFAGFPGQRLQSLTQFPIFAGKGFEAKTAKFSKHRRFDEDKGSMNQPPPAESKIQDGHHQFKDDMLLIPTNGRAAGKAIAGLDFFHHFGE